MKKTLFSIISLMLASLMLLSAFTACNNVEDETTGGQLEETTENITDSEDSSSSKVPSDSETETDKHESVSEVETSPEEDIKLEGDFGNSIVYANKLANGVQSYHVDAERNNYRINNMNMSLE